MSKGDHYRPCNIDRFNSNYDEIFRKKRNTNKLDKKTVKSKKNSQSKG